MRLPLRIFLLAAAAGSLATPASAANEKSFLTKALEGDNSEMTLGRMAEANGASPGVRDFGKMLREDHAGAKQKALPVAQTHGVGDTSAMAPEAKAEERKLKGLHGRAFDQEFARYMVEDHKKDIADFEKQARSGDRATRALAQATLPALKHHLQTAQTLASGSL